MAWNRQIKNNAITTKKGSAKIENFVTMGDGGLMLGRGCISHYSEYALSSTLPIYITLIAIVLLEYNAAQNRSPKSILRSISSSRENSL